MLDENLTEDELASIVEKSTIDVRRAAVAHPNISIKMMKELSLSGLAEEAYKNPMLMFHVESGDQDACTVLVQVAYQTKCPQILSELVVTDIWQVCRAVAQNSSTTKDDLLRLGNHSEKYVRSSVAGNRKTPTSELERLAMDSSSVVRSAVACNRNTPQSALELIASLGNANDSRLAMERLNSILRVNTKTPS